MKRLKTLLQSNLFYIFLFLFLVLFVFLQTKCKKYTSIFSEDTTEIIATIVSYKIDGDKLSIYAKNKETFVATYFFETEEEKNYFLENVCVGKTVKLEGKKQEILANTIPNTFNYKEYLYHKKIYFSFSINQITILEEKLPLKNRIKNIVQKRIAKLDRHAYIQAFVLGDKSFMATDTQTKIQENGVSHLFALSGMHVSFFVVFLNKILKKWKRKNVLIYIFLLFYLFLTSFPVSFVRAILFMFLVDANRKYNLGISNLKLLFLIAALLLFYNPFYIYDVGFLYSFIVTFSLLFASDRIPKKNKVLQLFGVSALTFLFSAPITVYMNYEVNLLSIFNNVLLVPLVSCVIFPFAILTFFCSFLLPVFSIFVSCLEMLNTFLNHFAFFIVVGKITIFEILLYYGLLIFIIKIKSKITISIFCLFLLILYNKDQFVTYSSVYFLDVGQGDSALLVAPKNREVIMIDTGGKISYKKEKWQERENEFNLSENIITFLKSMRIRHIDLLILTHGDLDHMGEAVNLVENFKVEKVIFNCGVYNDLENELIKFLDMKNIKHYSCIKELNIDNNKLYFLYTKEYGNENDNSNVLYTEFNNYKFLFMGDASSVTEREILNKYSLSNIDVIKAGHHGSKTSSSKEFINAITPKYSVISVGKNNRYGHPNKEVLDNLNNSKIYRTDQDGSIMFKIKNDRLQIETWMP